ncbi:MAG: YggS family pyridoxal phosphate-dependent enzyme [Sphaerochaetaceae bacterium]|nr:YggS family pyridoxal phosphate-dependent enzyme [Sphaerochaetaceae bacterium]
MMKQVLDTLHSQINQLNPNVKLMCVSKTHPFKAVESAYNLGERLFGENRVQEVDLKYPKPDKRSKDLELHLIGHLQSNKCKKAVELFDSIDSVDSIKVLNKINNYATNLDKKIDIMLEYNSSMDENKTGFETYEEIKEAALLATSYKYVNLKGLMTIGPLGGNEKQIRSAFKLVREIKEKLENELNIEIQELSMGMSGDYKIAIEEGSTIVRVGTKIFGNRDYSK